MKRNRRQVDVGGRPRFDPDSPKDVALLIRVTKEEKASIKTAAELAGLTLSEFVRRKALDLPLA